MRQGGLGTRPYAVRAAFRLGLVFTFAGGAFFAGFFAFVENFAPFVNVRLSSSHASMLRSKTWPTIFRASDTSRPPVRGIIIQHRTIAWRTNPSASVGNMSLKNASGVGFLICFQ